MRVNSPTVAAVGLLLAAVDLSEDSFLPRAPQVTAGAAVRPGSSLSVEELEKRYAEPRLISAEQISSLADIVVTVSASPESARVTQLLARSIAAREFDKGSEYGMKVLLQCAEQADYFGAFRSLGVVLTYLSPDIEERYGFERLQKLVERYEQYFSESRSTGARLLPLSAVSGNLQKLSMEFTRLGYQQATDLVGRYAVEIGSETDHETLSRKLADAIRATFRVHQEGTANLYDHEFAINCIGSAQVFIAHARASGLNAVPVQLIERRGSEELHVLSLVRFDDHNALFVDLLRPRPVSERFDLRRYREIGNNVFSSDQPIQDLRRIRIMSDQELSVMVNAHRSLHSFSEPPSGSPQLFRDAVCLRRLAKEDPLNFNTRGSHALCLFALEKWRYGTSRANFGRVAEEFDAAIALAPRAAHLCAYRGAVELALGRPMEAREWWERSLASCRPKDEPKLFEQLHILLKRGALPESEEDRFPLLETLPHEAWKEYLGGR